MTDTIETLKQLCEARINSCWRMIRLATKAYKHNELSTEDFRYIRNRLAKAEGQFRKIAEILDEAHTCADCAYACYSRVRVGDDPRDVIDEDVCMMEEKMTESDIDLCNAGHCPYWERASDEPEYTEEDIEFFRNL